VTGSTFSSSLLSAVGRLRGCLWPCRSHQARAAGGWGSVASSAPRSGHGLTTSESARETLAPRAGRGAVGVPPEAARRSARASETSVGVRKLLSKASGAHHHPTRTGVGTVTGQRPTHIACTSIHGAYVCISCECVRVVPHLLWAVRPARARAALSPARRPEATAAGLSPRRGRQEVESRGRSGPRARRVARVPVGYRLRTDEHTS
jgi:hypothetical protein